MGEGELVLAELLKNLMKGALHRGVLLALEVDLLEEFPGGGGHGLIVGMDRAVKGGLPDLLDMFASEFLGAGGFSWSS